MKNDSSSKIPVIDLFAGPGGLAEGFATEIEKGKRVFDIRLSIEKEPNAHQTLELRSFYRQFEIGKVPKEYYSVLEEPDIIERNKKKEVLFIKFPQETIKAKSEAWLAELGGENFPPEKVDKRISQALRNDRNWVLIGGPPCQAYSMAGRSRVGGIKSEDRRVYLYKEYLRIIAKHQPTFFVMENVKGLLSAKVDGERVFQKILEDLENPSSVFPEYSSGNYKIFSLSTKPKGLPLFNNPTYNDFKDYLIKCEDFGIPQKRHRVILLGIKESINVIPKTLDKSNQISLASIIEHLPKIRSIVNRSFINTKGKDGKIVRSYNSIMDTDSVWEGYINNFADEITSWKEFKSFKIRKKIKAPRLSSGSEFIKYDINKTIADDHDLAEWYKDDRLKGVINHKSRGHLVEDLKRYMFANIFTKLKGSFPRMNDYKEHDDDLIPDHKSALSGKFADRFRVQVAQSPATTVTSHISKDGHYFIHYDPEQCRSLTVREAARIQTFPDNYLFCGARTAQYVQVGNAVPPYLAKQIATIVSEMFKKLSL